MSAQARRARAGRELGHQPAMAVAGQVPTGPLRAAGWRLLGTLGAEPYDDRLDAATYVDPAEVVDDARLDAVAVDGADPSLAPLLPRLARHGLSVLLAGPAPLDVPLLQQLLAADPGVTVSLHRRWEPWWRTVAAAVPLAGVPLQVTVRGWPRGVRAAAELVDVLALSVGEVVAAIAAPAPMPAAALAGGEPVSWALLSATGATTLVSHEGAPAVRVSFAGARLLADPLVCRWEGGARLPLLGEVAGPTSHPGHPGELATAQLLAAEVVGRASPDRPWTPGEPAPGRLPDLLAATRVLQALRSSARTERLTPVA